MYIYIYIYSMKKLTEEAEKEEFNQHCYSYANSYILQHMITCIVAKMREFRKKKVLIIVNVQL